MGSYWCCQFKFRTTNAFLNLINMQGCTHTENSIYQGNRHNFSSVFSKETPTSVSKLHYKHYHQQCFCKTCWDFFSYQFFRNVLLGVNSQIMKLISRDYITKLIHNFVFIIYNYTKYEMILKSSLQSKVYSEKSSFFLPVPFPYFSTSPKVVTC